VKKIPRVKRLAFDFIILCNNIQQAVKFESNISRLWFVFL